jgi:hypothetical protein
MPSANKEIDEKFKNNENLPLVFADIIRVSQRNDGMCLLQFAAATPSTGFTEQTRVIVPGHAIKGLIQILGNMDAKDPKKVAKSSDSSSTK